MTIPTVAFATSYWNGEHLQSIKRQPSTPAILPLDAFRCEFMGHNWGVPAELLWYPSDPFSRREPMGCALLHDVFVHPQRVGDIDISSRLWKAMDSLGRRGARWLPYWENREFVGTDSDDLKVSIYNRPGHGLIAVVANMGSQRLEPLVKFDLAKLGQGEKLVGVDVLSGRPVECEG
ncbi:MAG TPA: DUF6067 family protein [Verrucomicrobiae bacterium]|nr:DUF6067 family protein [Verrucomicrobiae bacterium]